MNIKKILTFGLFGSSMAHPIRHSIGRNEKGLTNQSSNIELEYGDARLSNKRIDPYLAQSLSDNSTLVDKERRSRKDNVLVDHYLKQVKIQLEYLKDSDLSHTVFKEAIETMIDIAKYLKEEAHLVNTENIPRKPREQLDSLASLFNDAKIIYGDIENKLEGSNLKKNNILRIKAGIETRLGKIEEVVESYRGGRITDRGSVYSYYPNYKKRFKELSSDLERSLKHLDELEDSITKNYNRAIYTLDCSSKRRLGYASFEYGRHGMCTVKIRDQSKENELFRNEYSFFQNSANKLQVGLKNIESQVINERDAIKWFLDKNKIMSKKMALDHVKRYDKKLDSLNVAIKQLNELEDRCKLMVDKFDKEIETYKKSLSEKIAEASTKGPEHQKEKPLEVQHEFLRIGR